MLTPHFKLEIEMVLSRKQREALLAVYNRQPDLNAAPASTAGPFGRHPGRTYLEFRRTAVYYESMGCLMVPFGSMWLGIESDGYTHS
jgi:hypothetical protein